MKIHFIGTGCMASTKSANTSILIDNILFDCGMGTVKQLERLGIKTKNINYLVITHFHADHFFDIPNFLYGRLIRKECDEKVYVILPINGRRKVIDMMKFTFGDGDINYCENIEEKFNIEFIELSNNDTYDIKNYQIKALKLEHGDCIEAQGYLIKKDNIVVGYTGDTGICDNFIKMCEVSNCLLVDTTTFDVTPKNIHISVKKLDELAEKYDDCQFYAVHRTDYEIPKKSKIIFPKDNEVVEL